MRYLHFQRSTGVSAEAKRLKDMDTHTHEHIDQRLCVAAAAHSDP